MRFVSTVLCALAFAVPAEAADIENVTNLDIAISGSIRQHCALGSIPDAPKLSAALSSIPGVVDHGLFIGIASLAVIAGEQGVTTLTRKPA